MVAHNSHKLDQDKFFREKGSTLYKEEQVLLGSLVGLKVCHLQCNAGQDTLSLVTKLGAENPVGVDISDNAIEFAQNLSKESGIPATFIRADVFDYFKTAEPDQFDVVFISYGAVGWLSSMKVKKSVLANNRPQYFLTQYIPSSWRQRKRYFSPFPLLKPLHTT